MYRKEWRLVGEATETITEKVTYIGVIWLHMPIPNFAIFCLFPETNDFSSESDILNERLPDEQSLLCDVSLMRSLDHKALLPEGLLLPTKFSFSRNIASRWLCFPKLSFYELVM